MSNQRILFVDDEASLLALIGGALEDEGYQVTRARTGSEGVELLAGGGAFDCIISDVSMPDGISGIELATRARQLRPEARIILVSGHPLAHLDPLPEGVTFLPKPYRLGQLLDLLAPSSPDTPTD